MVRNKVILVKMPVLYSNKHDKYMFGITTYCLFRYICAWKCCKYTRHDTFVKLTLNNQHLNKIIL